MRVSLEDALDDCLGHLDEEGVAGCLERYPAWRNELVPLLEVAARLRAATPPGMPVAARAALKTRVLDRVVANPPPAPARQVPARPARPMLWAGGRLPRWGAPAAVALVVILALVLGSWPVAAASLPGDPLYGLKLTEEGADFWFAGDSAAQAAAHFRLADRRTGEIDTLTVLHRLVDAAPALANLQEHLTRGLTALAASSQAQRDALAGQVQQVTDHAAAVLHKVSTQAAATPSLGSAIGPAVTSALGEVRVVQAAGAQALGPATPPPTPSPAAAAPVSPAGTETIPTAPATPEPTLSTFAPPTPTAGGPPIALPGASETLPPVTDTPGPAPGATGIAAGVATETPGAVLGMNPPAGAPTPDHLAPPPGPTLVAPPAPVLTQRVPARPPARVPTRRPARPRTRTPTPIPTRTFTATPTATLTTTPTPVESPTALPLPLEPPSPTATEAPTPDPDASPPPGHQRTPPGHEQTPPGQVRTPPEDPTPPGQVRTPEEDPTPQRTRTPEDDPHFPGRLKTPNSYP